MELWSFGYLVNLWWYGFEEASCHVCEAILSGERIAGNGFPCMLAMGAITLECCKF
jgi:hypothetical protein